MHRFVCLAILLLPTGCDGDPPPARDAGRSARQDGGLDASSGVVCCPRDEHLPCTPGFSLGGVAGPGGCEDNVFWGSGGTWQRSVDAHGCPIWRDLCCRDSVPDAGIYCCGCDSGP